MHQLIVEAAMGLDDVHLEKLRRFALTAALALITYTAAGIIIEPHEPIRVLGVSFLVSRPNLLPVGLALASLCAAARFYYYGLMLGPSPYRRRRDLIDGLMVHSDEYEKRRKQGKASIYASGKSIWMYWGFR